jgi:hypothetical protein
VSIELFRDDDQGYAAWLGAHAHGYVLNIERTMNPSDARVHHANCRTITGTPPRGKTWTAAYVKACSSFLPEPDAWALAYARSALTRCGTCQPLPLPSGRPATRPQLQRDPLRTRTGCRHIRAPCRFFALTEARSGCGSGTQKAVICVARRGWEGSR